VFVLVLDPGLTGPGDEHESESQGRGSEPGRAGSTGPLVRSQRNAAGYSSLAYRAKFRSSALEAPQSAARATCSGTQG
jgi:hypothetical protein